jgi:hypothetical protein
MNLLKFVYSLTGISFVISDLIQLLKLVRAKSIVEFEINTWLLFLSTNLSGFIFADKIYDFDTILAYMGPALIDILIIFFTFYKRKEFIKIIVFSIILSIVLFIYFTFVYNYPDLVKKVGPKLGIYPAIILPLAIFLQLLRILLKGACKGVSIITWSLQLIGNVVLYFLLGKPTDPVAIFNSLVPGFFCLLIILYCGIFAKN